MTAGTDPDTITHNGARMDAAVERIERACTRMGEAHRDLKRRHKRLREEVTGALADLDVLIAEHARARSE